jgi:hypothetical protein
MQHLERTSRRNALPYQYLVLGVLTFTALLAVACGTSSPSSHNQSPNQNSDVQTQHYIQCLNQHGVQASQSNGAPQSGNGLSQSINGVPIQISGSSEQQVQAAEQACAKYRPNGGQGPSQLSAQQRDAMTKFVQCMNQQGVPMQQGQGGAKITNPQSIGRSKIQQAQQACQHYLPGNPSGAGS